MQALASSWWPEGLSETEASSRPATLARDVSDCGGRMRIFCFIPLVAFASAANEIPGLRTALTLTGDRRPFSHYVPCFWAFLEFSSFGCFSKIRTPRQIIFFFFYKGLGPWETIVILQIWPLILGCLLDRFSVTVILRRSRMENLNYWANLLLDQLRLLRPRLVKISRSKWSRSRVSVWSCICQ